VLGHVYELGTVVHHHGHAQGFGHYTADTRGQDGWTQRNDARVTHADAEADEPVRPDGSSAYLLTYVRTDRPVPAAVVSDDEHDGGHDGGHDDGHGSGPDEPDDEHDERRPARKRERSPTPPSTPPDRSASAQPARSSDKPAPYKRQKSQASVPPKQTSAQPAKPKRGIDD
jgi:hypothetical protein